MSSPAVARLSSPGEVLAVVPALCGFAPTESVVLLSLRGPRRRVGLTVRVDLPPDDPAVEDAVAGALAERVHADGASCAVVAVYAGAGRRESLVDGLTAACEAVEVPVVEALHVADGRWTSYRCGAACCPTTGTPVPRGTSALLRVEAERALSGLVVLGSRAELVRSLAPPRRTDALTAVLAQAEADRARLPLATSRRGTVELADALLDAVAAGRSLAPSEAVRLAVGLQDVGARDEVATRMLRRSDELLSLLQQAVRLVGPPVDAPLCTLLAWTAYARGNGAVANVALDRALSTDPAHGLALLLRSCLDAGVPPDDVRACLQALRTPG